ncbi:DNA excision repair protein ERCC-6-like isoform X1 [Xenia sp. Carnegie-2017]|uniref:DNA excision repair protein ERCC-6-like isoform X1 n=1 Tax=Xenia sp. Carnegie-2017 TaxID=2897299 RepID=UPI001F04EBB7|nr:DNA excision repair protein ERCC-6-like isoform X1 [Xenia sp. Carnegie-2017]
MISQPAYTEDSVNNSPCLLKTDVTDGHFQEVRKNISISFSSQASINSVVNSTGSHQDSDVLEEVNKDVELDVIMGNFLLPGDEKNQMKDKVKSIPSNIKEEEKTGVATKNNNGEYISKFIHQKSIDTILADDIKDDLETLSDAESEEFNQTFHSSITVSNTLNSEELYEDFTKQNGLVITGSESPTFDSPLLKYLEENIRNKVEDTTDFCNRNEEIQTDKNVNELRNELFKNENVQPILNDNISRSELMKLHPNSQHEVFTTSDASEHVLEVGSGLQIIEVKEDTTDITGDKNNKLVTGEEEEEEEEEENECPSKNLSTTFNEMTLLNSKTLNDKEVSEKWLEQVEGMSPVSNKDDESCNVEAHTDLPTHKVSSDSLSVESAIVVIRDVCSLRGSLNDSVKVYEAPGIVTCHNNGNVKTVEAHSSTFNDNKEVSHGNRFYNNNILKAPVTLPSTKTEILPCVDTLKCVDNVVNIVSRIDASKDSDETPGLMLGNSPNTYKRDRSSENDEEKKTYERGIRNGICIRFEQQCLSSDEIMSCETDKGNYLAREEQPMKAMGNNDVRDSSVVPIEVDQTESKQESEESEPKADHSFPHNSDYRINEFKKVETNQTLMQSKEMTQKMLSLPVRKTGGRKSEYT